MKTILFIFLSLILVTGYSQPALIVGSISASQTICAGTRPLDFTGTPPTNGTNPTYQWQDSPNNSTWTNITGATNPFYDPPILTATKYYRQQQNATGTTGGPLPTNVLTITVNASTTVTTLQNVTITGSACYNATTTLTVAGSGTTFIATSTSNVTIAAGSNIRFLPGTTVALGSHLRAYFVYWDNQVSKVNGVAKASVGKVNGLDISLIKNVNQTIIYNNNH